ncbi:TOBE domain-containing protein [bacterium]|nr:TOBE domain-containing protein [bacterium]
MDNSLDGRFWISKSEQNFLGKGRIELLKQIQHSGSITKAAKAMKMSYKAAWDAIDAMNNLAQNPLVQSSKGGKGGGGTHLTEYAKGLIETYEILYEEHQLFLHNLSLRIKDNGAHLSLLERMSMRVSARNQIAGTVVEIKKGAIHSEISLQLQSGDILKALLTNDSLRALDIITGAVVYTLFKAGALTISTDLKKDTPNALRGVIERINKGSVNAEVIVSLKGKNTLCATISLDALDEKNLHEGLEVLAVCEAENIILGTL